jgi:iron(III) transport system ATP-binding protein
MTTLEVCNLVKQFHGTQQSAVNNISFELSRSEILALVGPSGCGKTTTLRIIAGLERPDSGVVQLNDRVVASESVFIPPEKRGVGMVFQDHALFPHLTVSENIAFGLRGQSSAEIKKTVGEMLHLVGLLPLARRHPHALSGGERQRVALARALAPRPVLVLMDEPFSSLDADLRMEMREHVRRILKSMQATVIFVTHDQEEALYMGDRLAVLQNGHLEQIGTPEEIFHEANTRFVAEFMGDSDFLKGKVTPAGIQTEIGLLDQFVDLPLSTQVEIAIRADDINFQIDGSGNSLIVERFFRGAYNLYRLRLDSGQTVHASTDHTQILPVGARVRAFISAGHPLSVFLDE